MSQNRSLPQGALTHQFETWKLTSREAEVFSAAVLSTSHEFLRAQLGIREGTLKSHISAIIQKTREPSLELSVIAMRRRLLGR
jgi:DNA-binding NarL/FixJ family response regulator